MPIPFIQLPFARVRFVDESHPITKFSDLPNAFLMWTPKDAVSQVTVKEGVPHHYTPKTRVLLQVDRLFRRADARDENKLAGYMKDITKAIQQMTERQQFQEQYGEGVLDINNLRNMLTQQNAPANRITVSLETLPTGKRELKNFMNLHLDRLAQFSITAHADHIKARANEAFAGRREGHNAITGVVSVFDADATFAITHPLVDLRNYFNEEQIKTRVLEAVDENFPWMRAHNLFHYLEFSLAFNLAATEA